MDVMQGLSALQDKLSRLANVKSKQIARAAIGDGLHVMKAAVVAACPGQVGREVGARQLPPEGTIYRGKVGLQVGGAFSAVDNPHGRELTLGTKAHPGAGFVKRALESSVQSAFNAMQEAAAKQLNNSSDQG